MCAIRMQALIYMYKIHNLADGAQLEKQVVLSSPLRWFLFENVPNYLDVTHKSPRHPHPSYSKKKNHNSQHLVISDCFHSWTEITMPQPLRYMTKCLRSGNCQGNLWCWTVYLSDTSHRSSHFFTCLYHQNLFFGIVAVPSSFLLWSTSFLMRVSILPAIFFFLDFVCRTVPMASTTTERTFLNPYMRAISCFKPWYVSTLSSFSPSTSFTSHSIDDLTLFTSFWSVMLPGHLSSLTLSHSTEKSRSGSTLSYSTNVSGFYSYNFSSLYCFYLPYSIRCKYSNWTVSCNFNPAFLMFVCFVSFLFSS